jgi:hypothetical protein
VTDDWAADQADVVLARARERALELAVDRLAAELADELVQRARQGRRPRPAAAPAPAAAVVPEAGEVLWCYGVVDGPAPQVAGVDGSEVRAVAHGALTALVSAVPRARFGEQQLQADLEDLERLEALARAHERVLDAALGAGPVVPFRLCTIYATEASVRTALAERHDALAEALDRVRGMAEWSVKVLHRPGERPAPARETVASGADYLARKVQAREQAAAAGDAVYAAADDVHARLAEHAADAVLAKPQDRRLSGHEGEMVLNAAYLVAEERADGFRAVVEQLAARYEDDDLHFQLTGPWPAHHFTATEAA